MGELSSDLGNIVGRGQLLPELAVDVGLHDRHAVGGERAGLVRADGGGVTHGLTRVQVAHQVVVLHHLLDGVRQRDGHGEWKTFGHGHDEHGDTCDEELYERVEDRQAEWLLVLTVLFDAEANDKHDHCAYGDRHTLSVFSFV